MSTEPTTPPSAPVPSGMTVVNGGEKFVAVKADGGTQEVFIRLVKIREMDDYLLRYENISELVQFVTGTDADFVDSLDDDSLYELNRRVRAVNDPRFDRWVSEKAATVGTKLKDLLKRLRG